jgi:hypothetical protein
MAKFMEDAQNPEFQQVLEQAFRELSTDGKDSVLAETPSKRETNRLPVPLGVHASTSRWSERRAALALALVENGGREDG